MKKENFYKFSMIALIVFNIILLAFMFMKKPHHHGPRHGHQNQKGKEFQHKAPKMLNLNDVQIKQFNTLVEEHQIGMKEIRSQERDFLENYFSEANVNIDTLMQKMEQLESQKVIFTKKHFKDVQSILDSSQLKQFPLFLERATKMILTPGPKGPRGKGRNH